MILSSCVGSDDTPTSFLDLTFNFTHNWDGTPVSDADFNDIKFVNANGETISIERLRYLISRIVFVDSNNTLYPFNGYFLADVGDNNLSFTISQALPPEAYQVSFLFGFNESDNVDGVYQDLNSRSWNVPVMLGGGYHYMQLDGKYTGPGAASPENFNYHTIRAVDTSDPDNLVFQNTFFTVSLGSVTITRNTAIEIKMNIAEWFKNPNTWDLNVLNTALMANFDAQIMMNENGQNVFSLGAVTGN
jgi:hypothetical protein